MYARKDIAMQYNKALNFWGHAMTLSCFAIAIEIAVYYFFIA